jgi:hypothetical protein
VLPERVSPSRAQISFGGSSLGGCHYILGVWLERSSRSLASSVLRGKPEGYCQSVMDSQLPSARRWLPGSTARSLDHLVEHFGKMKADVAGR